MTLAVGLGIVASTGMDVFGVIVMVVVTAEVVTAVVGAATETATIPPIIIIDTLKNICEVTWNQKLVVCLKRS